MMKRTVAVDDGGANATTTAYCCNNPMTRSSDNDSDGERSTIVIEEVRIPSIQGEMRKSFKRPISVDIWYVVIWRAKIFDGQSLFLCHFEVNN